MKLNFGKRLVLFLHWLLSLIGCAALIAVCIYPQFMTEIPAKLNALAGENVVKIAGIAAAALYALLMVLSVAYIFSRDKKRSDRGFIVVDSSETGRTRIAVGAVEQMIRQSVRCVDGIADMKSSIINNEDAISINTSVVIVSGAHVPTVTMNIQRTIRSYIELNCGVAVREVSVSVQSLESTDETGKHNKRKNIPSAVAVQPTEQQPVVKANESVVVQEPVVQAAPSVEEAPVEEPVLTLATDAEEPAVFEDEANE